MKGLRGFALFVGMTVVSFSAQAADWSCRDMRSFVNSMYDIAEIVEDNPGLEVTLDVERDIDEFLDAYIDVVNELGDRRLTNSVQRLVNIWDKEEWSYSDYESFSSALNSSNRSLDRIYKDECDANLSANQPRQKPTQKPTYQGSNNSLASNQIAFTIRSTYPYTIDVNFHSTTRNVSWPGNNKVWTISDNEPHRYLLNCRRGEQICYGATVRNANSPSWGVGTRNTLRCSNCCYICRGKETGVIRLTY